jgi:hypothetical protein
MTLDICIREVLGSNIFQDTGYPNCFVVFLALQANAAIESRLGHDDFLSKYFLVNHSSIILALDAA